MTNDNKKVIALGIRITKIYQFLTMSQIDDLYEGHKTKISNQQIDLIAGLYINS